MITIDFETRSAAKIKIVGGWKYSLHHTTEPICLAYTLGDDDDPKIWVPNGENPEDLFAAIERGDLVEAHNAMFERAIWLHIMVPYFDWPEIPFDQWRCSAAKAAYHALPRKLELAAKALGLNEQKDMGGNATMLKVSRPRLALKAEKKQFADLGYEQSQKDKYYWTNGDYGFYLWNESPEDIERTINYCKQDVRTERALSQALDDLPPTELAIWQADQAINLRGVPVDRRMAIAAIRIAKHAVERATKKAQTVTGGAFETLKQRQKILDWLNSQGLKLTNLQAATVTAAIKTETDPDILTVLKGVQIASKTSVAKYAKLIQIADSGRAHDVLMYHGASTGRWTGRLLQTQNLVRGKMRDPDTMCNIVCTGDIDWVETCYGPTDPMTVLSWATRGAICAPEGRELICADFAGVEARGLLWQAGDVENIKVFHRPKGAPGIYEEMAAAIYNTQPSKIGKNSQERQIGKQAILGLGYGMGAPKFADMCALYGSEVDIDFAKHVVKTYRSRFASVPKLWKALENAALEAVRCPGTIQRTNRVAFKTENNFLFCRLPSQRRLAYYDPKLTPTKTPWGEKTLKVTYMSVVTGGKWRRVDIYGGKWAENIVQAVCRDLEAHALLTLESHPFYETIMHTHDEIVAECDEGKGDVKGFEELISRLPKWAAGFPLSASGWKGKRYRK